MAPEKPSLSFDEALRNERESKRKAKEEKGERKEKEETILRKRKAKVMERKTGNELVN